MLLRPLKDWYFEGTCKLLMTFNNTRYYFCAYINRKKYGILHCIIIPEHYELYEIEK